MTDPYDFLAANFANINENINKSCKLSGRDPSEICLIWVSKRNSLEMVTAAARIGAHHFGENRIQEAIEKFTTPPPHSTLHIIGPIQKNKMRKAVQLSQWIHTISSLDDLERLNRICGEEKKKINVLFQINTSGENTKSGIPLAEAESFLNSVPLHPNLLYSGLMTIATNSDMPEECRQEFAFLRDLRDTFKESDNRFTHFSELSMGMTQDMHIAIEEGATMIRIGTALFGKRE